MNMKGYREVSNRYSKNIKFMDKSEIDYDSGLVSISDKELFHKIFSKYVKFKQIQK